VKLVFNTLERNGTKILVSRTYTNVSTLFRLATKELSDIQGVAVYGQRDRAGVVSFNVRGLNPHDVSMILDETSKCTRKWITLRCASTTIYRRTRHGEGIVWAV
jgi:cysteine desulfurase/selenocysteine lyase